MTKCDLIVEGKYILTMNEKMEVIESGFIAVNENKILAIEKGDYVGKYEAKEILDTNNSILMPGMINAHTHVAMSYFPT